MVASVRSVSETRAGDTIFDAENHARSRCPATRRCGRFVFAGMYPTDTQQYETLRDALEKLKLNDASLNYEPETSTALGFGFRCGFLGLLHMEIVQERLTREFDLDLVQTVPSVEYKVYKTDGTMELVENPALMPNTAVIDRIEEPYVKARIMAPSEYIGPIMTLGTERRGVYKNMTYLDQQRVEFDWEFPLGEIILDFFDKLKSISRGYASLDYEMLEYRASDLVRLDMLINGDPIDAFSVICHEEQGVRLGAQDRGQAEGADPAPAVRGGDPGGDRHEGDRAHDGEGGAQGRAGEVLRRRHQPEAQAPREAEGGEEAHEAGRLGGDPAGGVSRGPPGRLGAPRAVLARRPDFVSRRHDPHDAAARAAGATAGRWTS